MAKLLNAFYEKDTDIPEKFRELYHPNAQGKFELDEVDDPRLNEFRERNRTLFTENDGLKRRLEPLEHVDLTKYEELRQKEQDLRDEKLYKKDKIEELVTTRTQAMKEDYDKKLEKANVKAQALERELAIVRIDEAAVAAATKLGVLPTAIDDIKNRIRGKFVLEEGKPVAYTTNQATGQRERVFGKSGGLLSIDEDVADLSVSAPHLFKPNKGTDTNQQRQGTQAQRTSHEGPNPWKTPKNLDECSRIAKENPQLANRLRKEAGLPEIDYTAYTVNTAPQPALR